MAQEQRIIRLESTVEDMKLLYRVLHRHLVENIELLDSPLLERLQRTLQDHARSDGVDVADHGAWDRWLGQVSAASCEERASRKNRLLS